MTDQPMSIFPPSTEEPKMDTPETDPEEAREPAVWDALKRGDVAKLAALLQ